MALDYGIIGNCKTAALVKRDASIEWLCFPIFDSPSVFAKILDPGAGSFEIIPDGNYRTKQNYVKNTNVLETVFSNGTDEFAVIDYAPLEGDCIHRILKPLKGKPKLKIIYQPRLDYARGETVLRKKGPYLAAENKDKSIALFSNLDYGIIENSDQFELEKELFFVVGDGGTPSSDEIKQALENTLSYWREYLAFYKLPEFHKEEVARSVLTLRILTYEPTGAMIAAATTSIPEIAGGVRNWDYRYCWIRDGAFAASSLVKLGYMREAERFINFMKTAYLKNKTLQIMYKVDGGTNLEESTLDHLAGYKNSKPVRIGNAAFLQLQIDVVGELLALINDVYKKELDEEMSKFVRYLVDLATILRKKKDNGIWEFRNIEEHFVFSKLMSWVAIDRGIQLAERFKKPWPVDEWKAAREELRTEILEKGWNGKAFTMYYGSDALDASVLVMHHYGFIDPSDEKFVSTVKEIDKELNKEGFAFRYVMRDDFGKPQNTFILCTFWLIDALHATGEKQKAAQMLENMIKHSNHLGLLSEGIDMANKELTGNFPQAYSHTALINTVLRLSKQSSPDDTKSL